ncbi:hypothetical protein CHS0354_000667 [Potamilus streckersoni]|uniref:tRNA-specific adenosine deaminase 2 n=1 Tax=Potamilus streckersoni TaxID=2493646 RepID=A0AAE0T736_9BIVA|nr:hypothetical protein CHS0354_000667 [Potamilus streckersoni]
MDLGRYMDHALKQAVLAFENNEVPVGAVVVDKNGMVISKGYNQVELLKDATAHAELIAMTSAMATLDSKYLENCTLYVTMEPCPMCAGAIGLAKLSKLVFGCNDLKIGAAGTRYNLTASSHLCGRLEIIDTGMIVDVLLGKDRLPTNISHEDNVFDYSGKIVSSGLLDMHVHFREPGFEHKETIATGATSAIRGGYTAVAVMPNTEPPTDNAWVVSFIQKKSENLLVDVLPIGTITQGRKGEKIANYAELYDAGVRAISDDGSPVTNTQTMRFAFEYASQFNLLVIQHCEDTCCAVGGVMNEGVYSSIMGLRGIPTISESILISRDLELLRYLQDKKGNTLKYPLRYHVAHISTERGIDLVRRAKKEGLNVTAEVAPHHFTLTDEDVFKSNFDGNFKMNPPLRTQKDKNAVIEAIVDGTIDCIATDHAPHSPTEKECGFNHAAFGIIGLETAVGLTFTELVNTGFISAERAIQLLSSNPRRLIVFSFFSGSCPSPSPVEYIVTFDSNGGSKVESKKVTVGNKIAKPDNPKFDGRDFEGWYSDVGLTESFDFDNTRINRNITLYAKWTIRTYTVAFSSNGGSAVPNATVNYGEKVTKPTDPTRAGYAFVGWYKDEATLTNEFNFTTEVVTANITLYAKWNQNLPNQFTVTFNSNGGSDVVSITVNSGSTIAKPTDPTRAGYTFVNWYKEAEFTNVFDFDTETITANITLFAKWEANSYTVTFNSNEGSTVASITVSHGNKITKPTDPTRPGYTFVNWYKEAEFTNEFNFTTEVVTANITLYAKWNQNLPNQFTVTFNSNEGSTVASITVTHGNKITKPTDPTRPGYTFVNWYKEAEFTNEFNFTTEVVTANITLYAKWNQNLPNQFTVTFNSNGGSAVPNATVNYGEKVTKPTDPTRPGYTFVNWYKEAEFTNVFNFDTETIIANITLYAKWDEVRVQSITLSHPNGKIMIIGQTLSVTATVSPDNALNKGLTWSSANPNKVEVTQEGLVIAKDSTNKIGVDGRESIAITVTSNDGSNVSATFNVQVDPYFLVPDANFQARLELINLDWIKDMEGITGDGGLFGLDINLVKNYTGELDVNNSGVTVDNKLIADLSGIEYFTSLTKLNCRSNKITKLDVSKNTALTELFCSNNQLSGLDVSKNTPLISLTCNGNKLSSLDVSMNKDLTELFCYNNSLKYLDASKNTSLSRLWCSSNSFDSLDIRGMRSVKDVGQQSGLNIVAGGGNENIKKILVHEDIKSHEELKKVKTDILILSVIISTYSAGLGSTTYTLECANWDPTANNGTGACSP